jgi:hypothetical protein
MTTLELPKSTLTKHQVKTYGPKFYTEHGSQFRIAVEVRYDDECGNGHNSFGITATIDEKRGNQWREYSGGCCHEEVAKHFPELAPFIKWHLCASDGPMHYLVNTLYHAGNRDHNGRTKGERYHIKGQEENRIVFGDFPISFEFKDDFTKFISSVSRWQYAEAIPVEHPPEEKSNYRFAPKWTIKGHNCEWYQCPFDREEEAKDFIKACQIFAPRIVVFTEKYTKVGEGKERQLEYARNGAIWPEATDEQLCSEPEELKRLLVERLPALIEDFKKAVESLGFIF